MPIENKVIICLTILIPIVFIPAVISSKMSAEIKVAMSMVILVITISFSRMAYCNKVVICLTILIAASSFWSYFAILPLLIYIVRLCFLGDKPKPYNFCWELAMYDRLISEQSLTNGTFVVIKGTDVLYVGDSRNEAVAKVMLQKGPCLLKEVGEPDVVAMYCDDADTGSENEYYG